MAIDTGLNGFTYNHAYPVAGTNQSTQQFRDNFSVIKLAVENLHSATNSADSLLAINTSVNAATGAITHKLSYIDNGFTLPNGLPTITPVNGMIRNSPTGIQYFDGTEWQTLVSKTVLNGANQTTRIATVVKDTLPTLLSETSPIALTYDAITNKLSGALTVKLAGGVSGTSTVTAPGEITVTATLDGSSVRAITRNMIVADGTQGISSTYDSATAKLTLSVSSAPKWALPRQITLAGDLSGSVYIDGTGDVTLYGTVLSATSTSNAVSANKWQAARQINLAGDLTGSVLIDGSSDVTLTASIAANSVALGADTTGNYVAAVATDGIGLSVSNSGLEGGTYTVHSNATSIGLANTIVSRDNEGNFWAGTIHANLNGSALSAGTSEKWSTARSITLQGDVLGTVDIDGSANVTVQTEVVSNVTTLMAGIADATAGGGIANATALSSGVNFVIGAFVGLEQGVVVLPGAKPVGTTVTVINKRPNPTNVWAPAGSSLVSVAADGTGAKTNFSSHTISTNRMQGYMKISATEWYTWVIE